MSRPVNATPPSAAFFSLEGRYHNAAYGILDLCAIPSSIGYVKSPSSSCKDPLQEIPIRVPGTINSSVPTFFARMDKVWVTHIRFEHFDGNLFNVSAFLSLVTGSLPFPTVSLLIILLCVICKAYHRLLRIYAVGATVLGEGCLYGD